MKCRHAVSHPGAGAATGPVGRVTSSSLVLDGKDGEVCEGGRGSDEVAIDVISGFPRSFSPMLGGSRNVCVQY